MPGIFGILNKLPQTTNQSILRRMRSSMEHEVSYRSGIHIGIELFFYIGWINHYGEFADCMPIFNESQDQALFLAGEVFHDPDIIKNLRNRGHHFMNGNASYLIHLYEEKGEKFFSELNGWFSGALLDYRHKRVFLFNDRYGMHRIFVHEDKDGLYFASEAKALLAVFPEARAFDPKGLGELLACGCTLGSRSLYKDIDILPSGSLWTFVNGEIEVRGSYFDPGLLAGERSLDEKRCSREIVELLGRIVNRYSGGNLPVGISLTGGLDSRMVMACIDMKDKLFPCYTFGSIYRDTFDVQAAREVAKTCNQAHHILVLGEEFLRELPKYLEKAVYISDGYIGLSGAAELYLNSLARNIAPVRLTGNYGGELLRGDRSFKIEFPRGGFVSPDLRSYIIEARKTFEELESSDKLTFALFHQAPSQGYGRLAIERSQLNLRSAFMDNDLVKAVYRAPRRLFGGSALSASLIARYKPDLLKIPTDRGLVCDSFGIVDFARRIEREALFKAEYWANNGMPTTLGTFTLKVLERFLQRNILGRHKFQHFRLWTQSRISHYITEMLIEGSRDLDGMVNTRQVENIALEHLTKRQNYTNEIDKLLTVTLIHHVLIRGS